MNSILIIEAQKTAKLVEKIALFQQSLVANRASNRLRYGGLKHLPNTGNERGKKNDKFFI